MKHCEKKYNQFQYELCEYYEEDSVCNGLDIASIMFHMKNLKIRKKYDPVKYDKKQVVAFRLLRSGTNKSRKPLTKHISLTEFNKRTQLSKQITRSHEAIQKKTFFTNKYLVNQVTGYRFNKYSGPCNVPTKKKWKQCQLSARVEDGCCRFCNSDVILYDCKKTYDNSNCILRCFSAREGKRLAEARKSLTTLSAKERKKVKEVQDMLKGMTPAEIEIILEDLIETGHHLPKCRTESGKALIKKVKAQSGVPKSKTSLERIKKGKTSQVSISPERLKRSKTLNTTFKEKPSGQQEKILKGLAMRTLPFPEGKTATEKKLMDKVRADLGLFPPEPKTSSMEVKYEKEARAGLLQPLKGKSQKEKEKILQSWQDTGIPLAEGRTSSEKAIISKVKYGPRAPPVTLPERLHKAKAAGLLTPLDGKTYSHIERNLKGLAIDGLPRPEVKTVSEKKLTCTVPAKLDLPPGPKTSSMKVKYEKAARAGLLQSLECKSQKEKEKILQGLHDRGIPLPLGRTSSEKALIFKVKYGPRAPSVMLLERLHKAKAAGLLTPLNGKTYSRNIERILKDLPPGPKTSSMKVKYEKAAAAGLLQSLKCKSQKEKEKILQGLHDRGIPLPEGRTSSEKALISKVKYGPRAPSVMLLERLHKAKAAGLLTPLNGKTYSRNIERILKDLPPEPKTSSMKVKYEKAAAAGLLQSLKCKSQKEKEKILQGLHDRGIPLPEGRTSSEKALISKVKYGPRAPSVTLPVRLHKAKAAGLLTPLDGKTYYHVEKILKGLAKEGLPRPEVKTISEKKLTDKVPAKLDLPPEPKTSSMKVKYEKAARAGLLQLLKGKSQKEKEIQGLHDKGIPLLDGQTKSDGRAASEKELIKNINAGEPTIELCPSEKLKLAKPALKKEKILKNLHKTGKFLPKARAYSEKQLSKAKIKAPSKVTSGKLRKARKAGLLTPLTGKSPKEKAKILKGLIELGLPLPESQTESEKKIAEKVRKEIGLPPEPTTLSEERKMHRAEATGIVTPLEGKSPPHKEHIVKDMVAAGIPLAEGRTASKKAMINRVKAQEVKVFSKTASNLLPSLVGKTPSQKSQKNQSRKGKIKTKAKKVGDLPSKHHVKSMTTGISEKFEDIIKRTTCDRGCGCNKKKIRFKHRNIKTRMTSPDITSLRDCPDECIPGLKSGVFIDNEGMKVTVWRVDHVTSFSSQFSNLSLETPKNIITLYDNLLTDSYSNDTSSDSVDALFGYTHKTKKYFGDAGSTLICPIINGTLNNDLDTSWKCTFSSCNSDIDDKINKIENDKSSPRHIETSRDIFKCSSYILYDCSLSYDSILSIKSEPSLSLTTDSSDSLDVFSVTSVWNSSLYSSTSTHVLYYSKFSSNFSNSAVENTDSFLNRIYTSDNEDSEDDKIMSESDNRASGVYSRAYAINRENGEIYTRRNQNDYFVYTLSTQDPENFTQKRQITKTNNEEPLLVVSNMDSGHDVTTIVDQLLAKNELSDSSSIIVIVSSISPDPSSVYIQVSENCSKWNKNQVDIQEPNTSASMEPSTSRRLKISAKGKKYCIEGMQETFGNYYYRNADMRHKLSNSFLPALEQREKETSNKRCQMTTPIANFLNLHGVSTDTTLDRPCCCAPTSHDHKCLKNDVSHVPHPTPILVNQGLQHDEVIKMNVTQQASFMSFYSPPPSPKPLSIRVSENSVYRKECCQNTYGTGNIQTRPCQCSPEKIKELLEQVLKERAGYSMSKSKQSLLNTVPVKVPVPVPKKINKINRISKINKIKSTRYGGVEIIPNESDLDKLCAKCKRKRKGGKLKCTCSGKKKKSKRNSLCPCEQFQLPVANTCGGPYLGTTSTACQSCSCNNSMIKSVPGALDHTLGTCQIEIGGTSCQIGQIQVSSPEPMTSKECICKSKKKEKKKKKQEKVYCECPPVEPEPEFDVSYLDSVDYKELGKIVLREKSDMAQLQSGFRMLKRKKLPPEPKPTVEDAVKYYVSLNPEIIKDLLPATETECLCTDGDKSKKKKKKKTKKAVSECSPTPLSVELDNEIPTRGLKLTIDGKGSGSKGLSGVCCFNMVQESNFPSTDHFD